MEPHFSRRSRRLKTKPNSRCRVFRSPPKLFWLLLLAVCLPFGVTRATWTFDLRTGVLYDSNVSHSDRAADVEQDIAWTSLLSAGQGFQLTDDLRLTVFAELESNVWSTYHGLSEVRPALAPALRYRFGLGKNAPWIRLEPNIAYADFAESRRSGWDVRPSLRGGFSPAEHFFLEAGYEFEHFDARDVVFQLDGHTFSLRGRIELTSSTMLAIGYSYRTGDVNSSAIPPRPDIIRIADVREFIDTFDEIYTAYRFPASTHTGSIAISQALGHSIALQLSYQYQHTAHDSLRYINHVAELGLGITF
jgi:hypothetical protein